MIEEIITIVDKQFKLTTDYPLTQEQRIKVISDISKQYGCSICGTNNIVSMANCTSNQKKATDTLLLSATPKGGQAPYTVTFMKGAIQLMQFTNVPENSIPITYSYTITGADVGTTAFSVITTDACPNGAKSCTEICNALVITNICSWISNIGGANSVVAANINTLILGYAGAQNLGFIVTAANINGAVLYYAKATLPGNSITGCNF